MGKALRECKLNKKKKKYGQLYRYREKCQKKNIYQIFKMCIPRDEIGEATSSRFDETVRILELGVRMFMWKETVVDGVDGDGVVVGSVRLTVVVGGDDEFHGESLFG